MTESQKKHYEKHKDRILEHKRSYYQANKIQILEKIKNDRIECPYCSGITFRRLYLPKHLETRHKFCSS